MKLKNVVKSYGEKKVLDGFNLEISEGGIVAIMGPSGCGKTTLLRIIAGLDELDSGQIEDRLDCRSMVFQEDRLCETSSAIANVLISTSNKKRYEALQLLEELGLGTEKDTLVYKLSGGMRRRVAIARAMISDSPLILMDEPFTGLDESNKQMVMECVKNRLAGKTAIIVTHDRAEAEFVSDRIVRLN